MHIKMCIRITGDLQGEGELAGEGGEDDITVHCLHVSDQRGFLTELPLTVSTCEWLHLFVHFPHMPT